MRGSRMEGEMAMGDFLINTTTNGPQSQPDVAGGSGYTVVWSDESDAHIKGQTLLPDGEKIGGEFTVSTPTPNGNIRRQLPSIEFAESGPVVAWIELAPAPHVKLQRFRDNEKVGPEVLVSTSDVDPQNRPSIADLTDGGFIVTWTAAARDQRIRAQRFGHDGQKIDPEFTVNTTEGAHMAPVVSLLADGNYVIAWQSDPIAITGGAFTFRVFNTQGSPIGGEIRTNLASADPKAMTMLDDGRFALAHLGGPQESDIGVPQTTVDVTVFEASGAEFSAMRVGSAHGLNRSWPAIANLPDGSFLVTWVEKSADTFDTVPAVMAKVFSDSEGPIGETVQVSTATTGDRFQTCAATDLTGGFAGSDLPGALVVWADDSHTVGDTSGFAVRGRLYRVAGGLL